MPFTCIDAAWGTAREPNLNRARRGGEFFRRLQCGFLAGSCVDSTRHCNAKTNNTPEPAKVSALAFNLCIQPQPRHRAVLQLRSISMLRTRYHRPRNAPVIDGRHRPIVLGTALYQLDLTRATQFFSMHLIGQKPVLFAARTDRRSKRLALALMLASPGSGATKSKTTRERAAMGVRCRHDRRALSAARCRLMTGWPCARCISSKHASPASPVRAVCTLRLRQRGVRPAFCPLCHRWTARPRCPALTGYPWRDEPRCRHRRRSLIAVRCRPTDWPCVHRQNASYPSKMARAVYALLPVARCHRTYDVDEHESSTINPCAVPAHLY